MGKLAFVFVDSSAEEVTLGSEDVWLDELEGSSLGSPLQSHRCIRAGGGSELRKFAKTVSELKRA